MNLIVTIKLTLIISMCFAIEPTSSRQANLLSNPSRYNIVLSDVGDTKGDKSELIDWKHHQNRYMTRPTSIQVTDVDSSKQELGQTDESRLATLKASPKFMSSSQPRTQPSSLHRSKTTTVRPFHGQIPRPSVLSDEERVITEKEAKQ